jgi:hypothetical protein
LLVVRPRKVIWQRYLGERIVEDLEAVQPVAILKMVALGLLSKDPKGGRNTLPRVLDAAHLLIDDLLHSPLSWIEGRYHCGCRESAIHVPLKTPALPKDDSKVPVGSNSIAYRSDNGE